MEVQVHGDSRQAEDAGAQSLSELFAATQDVPVLFLTSGGSALKMLSAVRFEGKKELVTMSVIDDRYGVSEEDGEFTAFTRTPFFSSLLKGGAMLIDTTPQPTESLQDAAERFDGSLKGWRSVNPEGVIIATMGVGEDGHTAGIMPYEDVEDFHEMFVRQERWVVGYDIGERREFPKRITTTIPFLAMVDHTVVYAVGESKRNALTRLQEKEGSINETPARILREMKDVRMHTDIQIP